MYINYFIVSDAIQFQGNIPLTIFTKISEKGSNIKNSDKELESIILFDNKNKTYSLLIQIVHVLLI